MRLLACGLSRGLAFGFLDDGEAKIPIKVAAFPSQGLQVGVLQPPTGPKPSKPPVVFFEEVSTLAVSEATGPLPPTLPSPVDWLHRALGTATANSETP